MNTELKKNLDMIHGMLETIRRYEHAVHVMNFDMETICPPAAMEEEGKTMAFLQTEGFRLRMSEEFIRAAEYLYQNRFGSGEEDAPGEDALDECGRELAGRLHREYEKNKNISPEQMHEFALIYNNAYADWLTAKNKSDYALFAPAFSKVRGAEFLKVSLREEKKNTAYDSLLDDYERGMTEADLDECFGLCRERLIPLLQKIMKSKKKIRTDFLNRTVTDEQQKKYASYLLDTIGYDFSRGTFTTTEHPFTDDLERDDVRVTTHYYPDNFTSGMYSIIHEGGHAIFGQNQPAIQHDRYIANGMTMGMHESVSRFYENRIGRSREFIRLVYPKTKEIFPGLLDDVTPEEFYEAVNLVRPSFVRTEADEFTYTFHIMIRYELEKMIMNGGAKIEDLPKLWNDKYEQYLGIRPRNDKEGVLQDVHWSSGFGYFPTYALGNMYNAMYYNRMKTELDIGKTVGSGDFASLNSWMSRNVFAKANLLAPKDWIKDITGREFTPVDFLDYLEEKYSEIYDI